MRSQYTGAGCLAPLMLLASVVLAVVAAYLVAPDHFPGPAAGLVIAAVLLVMTPVVYFVGWTLNSKRGPEGRVWHNRHTYEGTPVQFASWVLPVLALIAASVVVGAVTTPALGVVAFLVGGYFGVRAVFRRARKMGVSTRRP